MPKFDINKALSGGQGFQETLTPRLPTQADTSGIIDAARLEATAKVTQAKGNAELLGDVGKMAIDATKGFLESGLERDIKKTLAGYDTVVRHDDATLRLQMLETGFVPDSTPEDVIKAKADIEKYKKAMDQGVMSRDQAVMAIDKSVKDYSNTMPGFAADFRKLGYQLTGVEHLGARAEFEALSKVSINDKIKADYAKFFADKQQQMVGDFVNKYKRWPIGGLNGPEMAIFRQQAAIAATAENLKAQTEVVNQTVAQIEPKVVDLVNARLADGIITLTQNMQGIPFSTDPRTGKPNPPEDKAVLRQRILADTNTFFEGLKSEVLKFSANQLSNATREQLMARLQNQQTEMGNALKNQDAFDDMKKTMEIRQAKAQDVIAQWSIANPSLLIFQKSGLPTPDLAKFWIDSQRDPRRQADFTRVYGNVADAYYRSVSTGGPGMANYHVTNMSRLSTDPEHLDRLRETDPGAYTVGLHNVRDGIKSVLTNGWGQTPEMKDKQKAAFMNWVSGFGRQVDPKRQDLVDEWTKTMSDPRLITRLKELSPDMQVGAADAIMTRTRAILENPDVGFMKRLDNLVKEANGNIRGVQYDLVLNPTTKQIELTQTERKLTGKSQSGQTEAVTTPANPLLGFGEIKNVLGVVNRSLGVMSNVGQGVEGAVPPDMNARGLPQDYLAKLKAGFFSLSYDERNKALEAAAGSKSPKAKGNAQEKALSNQITITADDMTPNPEQTKQEILHIEGIMNDAQFPNIPPRRQKFYQDYLNLLKKEAGNEPTAQPSKTTP